VFVVAALALVAAVCTADELFKYEPPEYPCVWTVEAEAKSLFSYMRVKLYINSFYVRRSLYNYDDVLLNDKVYRPDITYFDNETNITYITVFSYSAQNGCQEEEYEIPLDDYKDNVTKYVFADAELPIFTEGGEFINKTSFEYDGAERDVYFDIDVDTYCVIVDKETQRIHAIIEKNDIPDQRSVIKFTYGVVAPYTDFVFDEKYVYNCTDNAAIFNVPTLENATCAASATHAVLAVVLVSLISAFIALF